MPRLCGIFLPGQSAMFRHRVDVVFVIGDLSAGGSQRVLQRISSELVERGHSLAVITLSDGSSDFFALDKRILRISLCLQKPSKGLAAAMLGNLRIIRRLRRELVQLAPATVCSFISVTNILAIAACILTPFHLVVCERNNPDRQKLGFPWQALRKGTYRWASLVTANSLDALNALSAYVPRRRLVLLRNPLPLDTSVAVERGTVVLAVGRLTTQKGFDVLLDAWANVDAINWQLHIVGTGPELGSLQSRAATLGIAGRIRFLQPVAEIMDLYRSASILAAPSRFEGTPNVVLEASLTRLPAVVSQGCGDALEIIQDRVSGRVVPVDDVDALRDALQDLIEEPGLRHQYGDRARARVTAMHANHLESWLQALQLPVA